MLIERRRTVTEVVLGEDVQRGELEGYITVAGVLAAWEVCALAVAEPGALAWDSLSITDCW